MAKISDSLFFSLSFPCPQNISKISEVPIGTVFSSGTFLLQNHKYLVFSRVFHWLSVATVCCFPVGSIALLLLSLYCMIFTDLHKYRGLWKTDQWFVCPLDWAALWLNMTKWWNQRLSDLTIVKMIPNVYVDRRRFKYACPIYSEDCFAVASMLHLNLSTIL